MDTQSLTFPPNASKKSRGGNPWCLRYGQKKTRNVGETRRMRQAPNFWQISGGHGVVCQLFRGSIWGRPPPPQVHECSVSRQELDFGVDEPRVIEAVAAAVQQL